MNGFSDGDWRRLVKSICDENCVVVLGPEIALDPRVSDETPLTVSLARELAGGLPEGLPVGDGDDLAHIAQLRRRQDKDRYELVFDVQAFYEKFGKVTSELHRHLAAIPFNIYLCTTLDRFLVNAFAELSVGRKPKQEHYQFSGGPASTIPQPSELQPYLYQLYGDISDDDSLVLSESDYLNFLVNIVKGTPRLPALLAAELADEKTSFLFLGFGFDNWNVRVLLHALQTHGHRNLSFALEGPDFFRNPDWTRAALFFEQEHKIEFRQHSWQDFAAELRRRVEEERQTALPTPPPSGAPKVFLCHDSRDRDRVEEVERGLREFDIDTWLDRKSLRAGVDWDRRIKQVIWKQVDYVLVLETPNMVARTESYIFQEIHEAEERQKRFPPDTVFLVPALLVRTNGLDQLDPYHRADLTEEGGLEKLTDAIKEDWERRQAREAGESN